MGNVLLLVFSCLQGEGHGLGGLLVWGGGLISRNLLCNLPSWI